MTLMLKFDLCILKMYLCTKNEVCKSRHLKVRAYIGYAFCSCDLDHDLMTLMYELDLDILKLYRHTKIEVRA